MTNARKSRQATAEKAAMLRAQQASQERKRRILLGAGAAVIVLAVAGGVTAVVVNARSDQKTSNAAPAGVQTFKVASRNHVQGTVKYAQTPPVGGDHNPTWLNCGIYDQPVPNENAVHDLEHGAVWITYQTGLAKAEVDKLKDIVGSQTYITMSPYTNLPNPITLSAWGTQLSVQNAEDPRIAQFIKKYKQGPQTPELGAACTGGTGTPTG